MSTLLLRGAEVVATMDPELGEVAGGWVLARDGWIEAVGPPNRLPAVADRTVDCSGLVLIPGLVNTHHHFYQTLTRTMAQESELFEWLVELYPVWARLTPEMIGVSTVTALAELALSGCTTAFDHHYLWPEGTSVDLQLEAAATVGLRFHASRGSMSLGASAGGLPPDSVVEDETFILEDTRRLVDEYHDPSPGAMTRIVAAPCSPFSVTTGLMTEAASQARSLGIRLHTHLAETGDEEGFCLERFGMRPVEYAESTGWLGPDVWFAHAVHVSGADMARMAATGTGVSHCPTSNMRLSSGIAPLARFLETGVPVGLGVDGSASNDSSHLLGEARQALLVSRVARAREQSTAPMLSARRVLEIATLGGAEVLGRPELGRLAPGMAADVACFPVDEPSMAGADDPVAGLVLCGPRRVTHLFVHGRQVVEHGALTGVDLERHLAVHRQAARRLVRGE